MPDNVVTQEPKKLSIPEFAKTIKDKYPQYENVNDTTLVNKIIEKYPQYKDKVDFTPKTPISEPVNNQDVSQDVTVQKHPQNNEQIPILSPAQLQEKTPEQKPIPELGNKKEDDVDNILSDYDKIVKGYQKEPINNGGTLPEVSIKSTPNINYFLNLAKAKNFGGTEKQQLFQLYLQKQRPEDIISGEILSSPEIAKVAPESYKMAVQQHKEAQDKEKQYFNTASGGELAKAAEYQNKGDKQRMVMNPGSPLGAPVMLHEQTTDISPKQEQENQLNDLGDKLGKLSNYLQILEPQIQTDKNAAKQYTKAFKAYTKLYSEYEPLSKDYQGKLKEFPYYVPRTDVNLLSKETGIPVSVYATLDKSVLGKVAMAISIGNPDFRNYHPSELASLTQGIIGIGLDTPLFGLAGKAASGITDGMLEGLSKVKLTKPLVESIGKINSLALDDMAKGLSSREAYSKALESLPSDALKVKVGLKSIESLNTGINLSMYNVASDALNQAQNIKQATPGSKVNIGGSEYTIVKSDGDKVDMIDDYGKEKEMSLSDYKKSVGFNFKEMGQQAATGFAGGGLLAPAGTLSKAILKGAGIENKAVNSIGTLLAESYAFAASSSLIEKGKMPDRKDFEQSLAFLAGMKGGGQLMGLLSGNLSEVLRYVDKNYDKEMTKEEQFANIVNITKKIANEPKFALTVKQAEARGTARKNAEVSTRIMQSDKGVVVAVKDKEGNQWFVKSGYDNGKLDKTVAVTRQVKTDKGIEWENNMLAGNDLKIIDVDKPENVTDQLTDHFYDQIAPKEEEPQQPEQDDAKIAEEGAKTVEEVDNPKQEEKTTKNKLVQTGTDENGYPTFEEKNPISQQTGNENVSQKSPVQKHPDIPTLEDGSVDYEKLLESDPKTFVQEYGKEFGQDEAEKELSRVVKASENKIVSLQKKLDKTTSLNEGASIKREIKGLQGRIDNIKSLTNDRDVSNAGDNKVLPADKTGEDKGVQGSETGAKERVPEKNEGADVVPELGKDIKSKGKVKPVKKTVSSTTPVTGDYYTVPEEDGSFKPENKGSDPRRSYFVIDKDGNVGINPSIGDRFRRAINRYEVFLKPAFQVNGYEKLEDPSYKGAKVTKLAKVDANGNLIEKGEFTPIQEAKIVYDLKGNTDVSEEVNKPAELTPEQDEKIKKIIKKQNAKPVKRKPGLYDKATSTDVEGNARGLVLQYFAGGGKVSTEGLTELLGRDGKLSNEERLKRISIIGKKEKGGKTAEMIAHEIWTDHPDMDIQELRNEVNEVLLSHNSRAAMANELLDNFQPSIQDKEDENNEAFKAASNGRADDYDSYVRFSKEVGGMSEQEATDAADMIVDPQGTLKKIKERNQNEIKQYNEVAYNELSDLDNEGKLPSEEELFSLFKPEENEQKSGNADNRSSEGRDLSNTEDNTPASTEADNGEDKGLSDYQQKVSNQYDDQIKAAEDVLSNAKKAREKKLAELQNRVGLFGDTQQFAGDMFNETFKPEKENFEKALKPFDEKIALAEKNLQGIKDEKVKAVEEAGKQTEIKQEEKPVEKPESKNKIIIIPNGETPFDKQAQKFIESFLNKVSVKERVKFSKGNKNYDLFTVMDDNGNVVALTKSPKDAYQAALDSDIENFHVVRERREDGKTYYDYSPGNIFGDYTGEYYDKNGDLKKSVKEEAIKQISDNFKYNNGIKKQKPIEEKQPTETKKKEPWQMTKEEVIGNGKTNKAARNWNEEQFDLDGSNPINISEPVYTQEKVTKHYNIGEAKYQFAVSDDAKYSGRKLLVARYVKADNTPINGKLGEWFPVGEYDGSNIGIKEAYRGIGAGTAFEKYLMENGIRKSPSIGYSPEGIKTVEKAHKQIIKEALSEGKPVPEEVLKDYPELKKPAKDRIESNAAKVNLKEIQDKGFIRVKDPKAIAENIEKHTGTNVVYDEESGTVRLPKKKGQIQTQETQPAKKIEDFGEKIEGAKKDTYKRISVNSEDIENQPLSKSFPKPDFAKLVKDGVMDEDGAMIMKFLYDEIPAKPRKKYRQKAWAETVQRAIDTYNDFLENPGNSKRFKEELKKNLKYSDLSDKFFKYEAIHKALGFPNENTSTGSYEIKNLHGSNGDRWSIVKGHYIIYDAKSLEDAANKLKEILSNPKQKGVKLSIYRDTKTNKIFIGKKTATGVVRLIEDIPTVKDASKILKEQQEQLQQMWDALKLKPEERREENRPREGVDYRNGKDVTPKEFQDTFGFRGVQFGNWVNNKERQEALNNAYDALMDLSKVLHVSPRALSLNGELGMAFGARGSGNASAHYESGQVVINMTKTKGAGSLAHEWWHALDSYFSRMRGEKVGFLTQKPIQGYRTEGRKVVPDDRIRKEMADAFSDVVDAVRKSKLPERSEQLDATRSKRYWSDIIEMTARSFENYVINKLHENNISNDYLANFKETGEWLKSGGFSLDNYPYPLAKESPAIDKAFDNFFNTIKEDENNVLFKLYSPTEYALDMVKQGKITGDDKKTAAEQWKKVLLKNGAKERELDWMGYDEAFKGKKTITKDDINNWIKENKVKLEEVVKGDNKNYPNAKMVSNGDGSYRIEDGNGNVLEDNLSEQRANDLLDEYSNGGTNTKFSEYKTPGGENYREVLLTLPERKPLFTESNRIRFNQLEYKKNNFGLTEDEVNERNDLAVIKRKDEAVYKPKNYKSPHFTEPNIVVHTRTQDFKDEDGNKVLNLEEVQSDWGQEGKKKGFASPRETDELIKKQKRIEREISATNDSEKKAILNKEWDNLQKEINRSKGVSTVPDMPFRKTPQWAGLALKRMVQEAAENGYDAVTWTTGEQQAERYDLSKQIEEVEAKKVKGKYVINLVAKDGRTEMITVPEDELADHVGKDLAEKIIKDANEKKYNFPAHESNIYSGLDLKVGGEGMKGFYDDILPKLAEKLFKKKYGATVDKSRIKTSPIWRVEKNKSGFYDIYDEDGTKAFSNVTAENAKKFMNSGYTEVWKLKLTDKLKDAANSGFPIFKNEPKPEATSVEQALSDEHIQRHKEWIDGLRIEANHLADETGVKVNFVNSWENLPDYLKRLTGDNRKAPGMYDKNSGEVYIVLSNILDYNDLRSTFAHEVIGHKGIAGLFGDRAVKLLMEVYKNMTPEERHYIEQVRGYGEGNAVRTAEEYLGWKAESYERPSWLKRTYAKLRDWFRRYFGLKYSDNDINSMLAKSEDYLKKQKVKEEPKFAGEVIKEPNLNNRNDEIKDANELKEKVHKLGYTFSRHVAKTGSEYIKVNGQQFRLADHEQPSSYQVRNYRNVKSLQEIYDIVSSKEFKYANVFTHEADGKYFKDYEDESHDVLSKEISKKEFDEINDAKSKLSLYNPDINLSKREKPSFNLAGNQMDFSQIFPEVSVRDAYDLMEDKWIGERQVQAHKADVEKNVANDKIKEIFNKDKPKLAKSWRDLSYAMKLYREIKGDPDALVRTEGKIKGRDKRIVELSQNLPEDAKKLADKLGEQYDYVGKTAQAEGVIQNFIENYVDHLWDLPKNYSVTEYLNKFSTSTSHSRERTLPTILDGLAEGYHLKVEGIADGLALIKKSIYPVIENRRLIEAGMNTPAGDGKKLFMTSEPSSGDYKMIENPYFTRWRKIASSDNGLDLTRQTFKDRRDIAVIDKNTMLKRERIYAPKEIADRLNNILSSTHSITGLEKFNRMAKGLILSYSFFHHLAYTTSYELGAALHSFKDMNPVRAYKEGVQMIYSLKPDLTHLVRNGLTLGLNQDYGIFYDKKKSRFTNWLNSHDVSPRTREKVSELYNKHTEFLFNKLGAGLKAKAALMEYSRMIEKHPDMDRDVAAKAVAKLVNADFGGLNHERMGRSAGMTRFLRAVLLAPDWTESNLLTMERAFGADHVGGKISKEESALYKRFWLRAALRGAVATTMMNLMMTLFNEKDNETYWDALTRMYKEMFRNPARLNWLALDITPVYREWGNLMNKLGYDENISPDDRRYLNLFRHFLDPAKWVLQSTIGKRATPLIPLEHKASVITRLMLSILRGQDWQGKRYTTIKEVLGTDDKGEYIRSRLNPNWNPTDPNSKKYLYRAGDPKGGKLKGKLTKWGTPTERGSLPLNALPSFILATARSVFLPIPVSNMVSTAMGEMDTFDMLTKGFGFYVSRSNVSDEWETKKDYKDVIHKSETYLNMIKDAKRDGDGERADELRNKKEYQEALDVKKANSYIKDLKEQYNDALLRNDKKTAEKIKESITKKMQEINKIYNR